MAAGKHTVAEEDMVMVIKNLVPKELEDDIASRGSKLPGDLSKAFRGGEADELQGAAPC